MYQLKCLCGATIQTKVKELECPMCKRWLRIDWGETPATVAKPTKTATEKYEKHP